MLPNSFYKANIVLTSRGDKNRRGKKKYKLVCDHIYKIVNKTPAN